ncbi:PD-(D/E)XK motif protein [Achromobacter insolitus]|uniref:PD-(D/E)XK motif protein n=1 Tax=Achromobacter insolitus TaxID=217204 RepID=UPI0011EB9870|nr:PD-(D/E)XK motif protein [Achromobacter insolitus]QEK90879.1 PD-(D/E)XK motif protein [Achromobacter insolitus]
MDLFAEFLALVPTASPAEFAAVPTSERRCDFLAKSADGAPVFLISDSSAATYTPGVSLKHLSVQYHATCRILSSTGCIEGQFALIMCHPAEPELYELFVRCVGAAVQQLPDVARTQEIEACVRSLLSLFRAMSAPGGRELAGLWAELFVITLAADAASAVRAWHSDAFERFDFSWPDVVLEVKATQDPLRVHEFSLEQLSPPLSGRGVVASLLVQPLTNGLGVMDLANRIDARLHGENNLRQRLWSNIATALGNEFGQKLDRRFDVSFAERQVAVFEMEDIPAPCLTQDPRVSSVRFRSDLTGVVSSLSGPPLNVLREMFENRL